MNWSEFELECVNHVAINVIDRLCQVLRQFRDLMEEQRDMVPLAEVVDVLQSAFKRDEFSRFGMTPDATLLTRLQGDRGVKVKW